MPDAQNWLLTNFFLLNLHERATSREQQILYISILVWQRSFWNYWISFFKKQTNIYSDKCSMRQRFVRKRWRRWRNKKGKKIIIKGAQVWYLDVLDSTTEEGRGEARQRECLCPLSWSVHHHLAREGYFESTCCCIPARFLAMETKILFSL